MLLGIVGPCISISQPGLGLSTGLLTAWSLIDQGLADRVLLGAADDWSPSSRLLFPDCGPGDADHSPCAIFTLLDSANLGGGLVEAQSVEFSSPSPGHVLLGGLVPGPVDVLSRFLTVLDPGRDAGSLCVEESWDDCAATIHLRPVSAGNAP